MSTVSSRLPIAEARSWLRLHLPHERSRIEEFCLAAVKKNLPLDVSFGSAIWGQCLGDSQNPLIAFCREDFLQSQSANDACDKVSAQIIQLLSSLHGRTITALFVPSGHEVPIDIWDGVIQALSFAKEDGLVRSTGLHVSKEAQTGLSVLSQRDSFDCVFLENPELLADFRALTKVRRMEVITSFEVESFQGIQLKTVSSFEDLNQL